ncbi:MAG: hypothetical protein RI897_3654 [Verrucomicrobiota bacterium]
MMRASNPGSSLRGAGSIPSQVIRGRRNARISRGRMSLEPGPAAVETAWGRRCRAGWRGRELGPPRVAQGVGGFIPAQFVFEVTDAAVLVDEQVFDAGYFGEVVEVFRGEGLTEAGVVGAAGVDPAGSGGGEIGVGIPEGAGYGEFGQGLVGFDDVDRICDKAEAVPHIDEAGIEAGAGGRIEDESGGVGFASDTEGMDFEGGFCGCD